MLEADTIGFGASGRNGGFVMSSLTHGLANGLARFEAEMPVLERLGAENLAGMQADLERHGIDCRLELAGDLIAILEPYQDAWIEDEVALLRRFGHDVEVFDGAGDARRGRLADVPGGHLGPDRRGPARPRPPRRRAARGGAAGGGADLRGDAGRGARALAGATAST